jgi:hypothetical protein
MGRLRLDAWDLVPCGIVSLPAKVTLPTALGEVPSINLTGDHDHGVNASTKIPSGGRICTLLQHAPRHFAVLTAGPDLRTLPQIMKTYT